MKEYIKHVMILVSMLIAFYLGHEVGYQKASARIYQSINHKTLDSWIASIVEYQIDQQTQHVRAFE